MEPKISKRIIRNNKRVGMFMAWGETGGFRIGFALCNPNDKYSHELAKKICHNRAFSVKDEIEVPNSLSTEYDVFYNRCVRYFKEDYVQS